MIPKTEDGRVLFLIPWKDRLLLGTTDTEGVEVALHPRPLAEEIDYLIRLALPDIEAYDAFYKRLIARVELSDVTSMFAMEEIKSTTRLPLSYLP